jgi:leucyl-tRNA synthetase
MKMLNLLESKPSAAYKPGMPEEMRSVVNVHWVVTSECMSILLCVLYPACPHITHALWKELGYAAALGDLVDAPWPQVDEAALVQDEIDLVVQVNGKLRGSVRVPAHADRSEIERLTLAQEAVQKFLTGAPKKIVVVPGRLVNVVV